MVYLSTESHSGCLPRDGIYLIAMPRIVFATGVYYNSSIHGSQEMDRQVPDHGFRVLGHVWIVECMQLMRHTLFQRSIFQTTCISRSGDLNQTRLISTKPPISPRWPLHTQTGKCGYLIPMVVSTRNVHSDRGHMPLLQRTGNARRTSKPPYATTRTRTQSWKD